MKKIILLLAFASSAALAADPALAPYPVGYRDWTHVKSMVINPGHPLFDAFGGIHHLYANKKALAGYKSGKFPDGSVIVFVQLGLAAYCFVLFFFCPFITWYCAATLLSSTIFIPRFRMGYSSASTNVK